MNCRLCTETLSPANFNKLRGACASCKRQYDQMRAGFKGVRYEPKDRTVRWDNSEAYEEWVKGLEATDADYVSVKAKEEYTEQRCDIRDMRADVGLPKLHPLEKQVYTAWIEDGVKDEKMQEVLGLTYRQLHHIKSVVRMRLRKQMNFYHQVKKLEAQAEDIKKRKGL